MYINGCNITQTNPLSKIQLIFLSESYYISHKDLYGNINLNFLVQKTNPVPLLWAHFDAWRHQRGHTILADTNCSRCTTVQWKYRQLVTTCWFANLSEPQYTVVDVEFHPNPNFISSPTNHKQNIYHTIQNMHYNVFKENGKIWESKFL